MATNQDADQRVRQLRTDIRRHDHLYYVKAEPRISDREYDRLLAELKEIEAEHPDLVTPDSPTQRVAGRPLDEFTSVPHAVPMLSIDNTYSEGELREFDGRVRRGLNDADFVYVVDPKIDGVAISLRYEAGRLVLAATRGDGTTGDDVTQNARTIRSIPLALVAADVPDIVEVRGEAYWPNHDFARFNAARQEAGEPPFANPRNATAGTLKQLDSRVVDERNLAFIAHGFGQIEPMPTRPAKQQNVDTTQQQNVDTSQQRNSETAKRGTGDASDQPTEQAANRQVDASRDAASVESQSSLFDLFEQWGIPVSPYRCVCASIDDVIEMVHEWDTKRHTLDYETDGLVVKVDRLDQRDHLGATSRYPRWCIAFKFAAEQAESVLRDVVVQVGKLGTITPVAHLEPVQLAGTTVKRANLHNFDQIERLGLMIGDTVLVEKAGEIIPQVVGVIEDKRPADARPISRPKQCPVCAGRVARDEGGVSLRCTNPECPAQIKEKLRYFCARDQMDIEGIGPALIDQLVDNGLVQEFADLYRLRDRRDELINLQSEMTFGARNTTLLLNAIEKCRAVPTDRVLSWLELPPLSQVLFKSVSRRLPTLGQLATASQESLVDLPGIPEQASAFIVDFFRSSDPEMVKKRLVSLSAPAKLDISGLGSARIDKLIDEGLLKSVSDIFTLADKREMVENLAFPVRLGEKNADAILTQIETSKTRGIAHALCSLSMPGLGPATAEEITDAFPTIEKLLVASETAIRKALIAQEDKASEVMAEAIRTSLQGSDTSRMLASLPHDTTLREALLALKVQGIALGEKVLGERLARLNKSFGDITTMADASVEQLLKAIMSPTERKKAEELAVQLREEHTLDLIGHAPEESIQDALPRLDLAGFSEEKIALVRIRRLTDRFGNIGELAHASPDQIRSALATGIEGCLANALHEALEACSADRPVRAVSAGMSFEDQIRDLGVPGLVGGEQLLSPRIALLEKRFRSIHSLACASQREIAKALAVGGVVAGNVHHFLHHQRGKHIIESLRKAGVQFTRFPKDSATEQPFSGKTLAVTGSLEGFTRRQIVDLVKLLGGRVAGSVGKNTDFLLVGKNPGTKLAKAQQLGIPLLNAAEFSTLSAVSDTVPEKAENTKDDRDNDGQLTLW